VQQQQAHQQHQQLESPLHALTDFEYAQYALVCPADEPMSITLYRISMLQAFKREFSIVDTVEQGRRMMDQGTQLMPGFLLSISELATQNFVSMEDWSKFYPSLLQNNEKAFRVFIGLLYYKAKAKEPHLLAIRNGISSVIECTGMTRNWQDNGNGDMAVLERILHSFWRWYPSNHKETYFMNSPSLISEWCGLFKKFLPFGDPRTMKIGMQVPGMEGERIDAFYRTPSSESARQEMLRRVGSLLELRYHNESRYVLPPEELGHRGRFI
jgi:hypothetical protein